MPKFSLWWLILTGIHKLSTKKQFELDVKIQPSKRAVGLIFGFWLTMVFLAGVMDLIWWQWGLFLGLSALLFGRLYGQKQCRHIACQSLDGIWQLLMVQKTRQGRQTTIHQAYLKDVRLVQVGFGRVLVLEFFVISPIKGKQNIRIFEHEIAAEDFSKLMVLARFGGYWLSFG